MVAAQLLAESSIIAQRRDDFAKFGLGVPNNISDLCASHHKFAI
jgi:hypothetical protein